MHELQDIASKKLAAKKRKHDLQEREDACVDDA